MYYSLLICRAVHLYILILQINKRWRGNLCRPIFFTPLYGHHLPIYKIMTVYHLSVNRNRRKREISVRSSTCILWAEETTRKTCRVMFFNALISADFFTVLFLLDREKVEDRRKRWKRCLTQNQFYLLHFSSSELKSPRTGRPGDCKLLLP